MFESNQQLKDWQELSRAIDDAPSQPQCYNFPEAYFPEKGTAGNANEFGWAKQMCDECPVKKRCAEYALRWEVHGIWGGLSSTDRREARKKLRLPILPAI
jgi:WhiB family redox-sensing transcriptional regulator